MAPAETEKGRDIQRYGRNLQPGTLQFLQVLKRFKLELLLHYPGRCFPAADILMLMAAAHVGETPLFKCFKRHGCGIMISGKKVTGLMRQALPAFEPESLGSQFQGSAMDKEHPAVNPFHRHVIED
jgi:hypothetical protein